MRKKYWTWIIGGVLLGSGTSAFADTSVIYSNNFTNGAGSEWSNASTVIKNGETFLGGTGYYGFGNGKDILTLTGLSAHTSVTVTFDLYIIGSWDGNGQNGGSADCWQLLANGTSLLYTNFANYEYGNTQAYPNQAGIYGSSGAYAPRTGASENNHLGYGNSSWGDATYHFSFTIDDTDSTLIFDFISLQNQSANDEGWGLDNVTVSIASPSAVPVPSSFLLMGSGMICLAGLRKRGEGKSRG